MDENEGSTYLRDYGIYGQSGLLQGGVSFVEVFIFQVQLAIFNFTVTLFHQCYLTILISFQSTFV